MVADDRPYVVESPTRIRLGPDAKHWAHEYGMTLEEFARYLLHRHHHGEDVCRSKRRKYRSKMSTSPMASSM